MEDVREEAGVPIKIKLLLLHVIVVTHLQEGGKVEIRSKNKGKKGETFPHLQDVLLRITRQQFSQSGVGELLQRAGAEAPLQAADVHVDQPLV